MNGLIKKAIERPVAVLSVIFLIILFGFVALRTIPIQMSPDIEKPQLQVRVSWPGASPEDVDREIVNRLENDLSSLKGVEELSSSSLSGQARIGLRYGVGQDMDKAISDLVSQLASVSGLPDESRSPRVRTSNSDDSPIARMALSVRDGEEGPDLEKLGQFVENEIVARLGRIEGVAEITFNGGGNYEMRVNVDAVKLSQYQLSVSEVLEALRNSTSLQSVGRIDEGKRTYTVRSEVVAYTPETAANIIVRTVSSATGERVAVRLGDIANFQFDTKQRSSFRRLNGRDAVIINALREQGSNVVETMQRLRAEVDALNNAVLKNRQLELSVVFDETTYIASAIDLVQQNIWVGGMLALSILMLFLRSVIPTLIIFIAVPVSVVGTFVAIAGLGLSINVISLAGLAFAVGMVVDASIVSMENIFRLRQSGLTAPQSAYRGARQVWAPILGSALTTVLVFIPVVSLELPVGQLFRDIGIAISVSVLISVFISVTVIPSLAARLLSGDKDKFKTPFPIWGIDHFARAFSKLIISYTRIVISKKVAGIGVVAVLLAGSLGLSYTFMPKLDYLPDGNANFVFG
ncbi:MAG: efflux RND transporter permease subunit, partial [Candidatus Puniceispirillaceae bacterium]